MEEMGTIETTHSRVPDWRQLPLVALVLGTFWLKS